jgi:transcriptional regulator NrdR family protein
MAERKKYSGVIGRQDGIECEECGCRMSHVVKTEHIGCVTKRIRHCRHCGYIFHTLETRIERKI